MASYDCQQDPMKLFQYNNGNHVELFIPLILGVVTLLLGIGKIP